MKFNNLGLALATNLKFYTSVSKGLKLKVRKFWELIPTFVEVTGEKLVGVPFCPRIGPPIRVKETLDRGNSVSAIFTDLSKAFDSLDHDF